MIPGQTGSQAWEPQQLRRQIRRADENAHGPRQVENMVSIRILQAISPAYAQDYATRFGFDADKHPPHLL